MKSTEQNNKYSTVLQTLENIRQRALSKQDNKTLKNKEAYELKHKGLQYLQIFVVLLSVVILTTVFNLRAMAIVLFLNIGTYHLKSLIKKPIEGKFDMKSYNQNLLKVLHKSFLPNSGSTTRNHSFKSFILDSKLIEGDIELLDRYEGQLSSNKNTPLKYNFSTIRVINKNSITFSGTAFLIDNPKIRCKELVIEKGFYPNVPKRLKGHSSIRDYHELMIKD